MVVSVSGIYVVSRLSEYSLKYPALGWVGKKPDIEQCSQYKAGGIV